MKLRSLTRSAGLLICALLVLQSLGTTMFGQQSITLEELRRRDKEAKMKEKSPVEKSGPGTDGLTVSEVLAEGSNSKVDKPFIFVARDDSTLEKIGDLIDGFSLDRKIDFQKFAVVAAFSGQKESGGFSVMIKHNKDYTMVIDVLPVHGSIVTTALTTPYRVSLVPVEEQNHIGIALAQIGKSGATEKTSDPAKQVVWYRESQKYLVTDGEFRYSGGFLGESGTISVTGSVRELTFGDLKTYTFALVSKDKDNPRTFSGFASAIKSGDKWVIPRAESSSLIPTPHPPFVIDINTTADGGMILEFGEGKRPYVVSDGYNSSGTVSLRAATSGNK